ncbi:hypothetical protein [Geitlerinema sp. PCC 7407]|uniref:hypothetical protein n=1 Tax=Geitlerinema sp. PCC 7407 TaxID=1173025 RepID=UPI00029FCFEF|nr:hypothetical protein [Geitlerinema sp. PCC 7407]AFY67149.1 low temperature-induced protein [Geitlerinema sp. PCC 7407]
MKTIRQNFSAIVKAARVLVLTFVCTLFVFASAAPAFSSDLRKGEDALKGIQKESEQVLRGNSVSPSLKETQRKANEGINEVQGAADAEKMNRPSNSQGAKTVEESAKNVLESMKEKAEDVIR